MVRSFRKAPPPHFLAWLSVAACSASETIVTPPTVTPPVAAEQVDGSVVTDASQPADSGTPDDGGPTSSKIGTLKDKGFQRIDVNISSKSSYTCKGACSAVSGVCDESHYPIGRSYRKYKDGSGTFDSNISSCTEVEDYDSFNTTLTAMDCYCDGLAVDPTVRVKKSEGLHACADVCASWELKCSPTRKSYAYADEEESSSAIVACATAPASGTHHYVCACEP